MPTPRVLLGMILGALVATIGALFLGEYEFDELLPIVAGALLGLILAEVVVSVGRVRNLAVASMTAAWSATAVVLAGLLDANETAPIKWGAYLSAVLAALAALARANDWRRREAHAVGSDVASGVAVDNADRAHEPDDEVRFADEADAGGERRPARRKSPPLEPRLPSVPSRSGARTARRVDAGADAERSQAMQDPDRITVTARKRPRTSRDR